MTHIESITNDIRELDAHLTRLLALEWGAIPADDETTKTHASKILRLAQELYSRVQDEKRVEKF